MSCDNFSAAGHGSFVNSCHTARRGPVKLCSGSDDCTIKIWDPRQKNQATTLNNTYQVTAVTFNDTAEYVISGGIDNDVKVSSPEIIQNPAKYWMRLQFHNLCVGLGFTQQQRAFEVTRSCRYCDWSFSIQRWILRSLK